MKPQLLEQFKAIRETLTNNVDTIGRLISQAQTLSQLAEQIPGTNQADKSAKSKLQEEVKRIQESIASLIDQTKRLFELYDRFAEDLFENK